MADPRIIFEALPSDLEQSMIALGKAEVLADYIRMDNWRPTKQRIKALTERLNSSKESIIACRAKLEIAYRSITHPLFFERTAFHNGAAGLKTAAILKATDHLIAALPGITLHTKNEIPALIIRIRLHLHDLKAAIEAIIKVYASLEPRVALTRRIRKPIDVYVREINAAWQTMEKANKIIAGTFDNAKTTTERRAIINNFVIEVRLLFFQLQKLEPALNTIGAKLRARNATATLQRVAQIHQRYSKTLLTCSTLHTALDGKDYLNDALVMMGDLKNGVKYLMEYGAEFLTNTVRGMICKAAS